MDVHEQRVEFVMAAARKSKPFRFFVPGIWHITPDRIPVVATVSAARRARDCGAQSQAAG